MFILFSINELGKFWFIREEQKKKFNHLFESVIVFPQTKENNDILEESLYDNSDEEKPVSTGFFRSVFGWLFKKRVNETEEKPPPILFRHRLGGFLLSVGKFFLGRTNNIQNSLI
jgi:hypothetical protein